MVKAYTGNVHDPTAIGVYKDDRLVGHVPRAKKHIVHAWLLEGDVSATVTNGRCNRGNGCEVLALFRLEKVVTM